MFHPPSLSPHLTLHFSPNLSPKTKPTFLFILFFPVMAETTPKRQREETHNNFSEENQDPKRQKSYDQILSLLEEEEEVQEPNQDFSSILTTLQRELDPFSVPGSDSDPDGDNYQTRLEGEGERDETERFMRHLLEASDDELGIPNRADGGGGGGGGGGGDGGEEGINGGDEILFCDGLWDLEDDAANYYSLLQSELFL